MNVWFNVDSGEGFKNEALIAPYIDGFNISCGGHAGDLDEITEVVLLAKKYNKLIGAHPSYVDKANFGRKVLPISKTELSNSIIDQISRLQQICNVNNVELSYVKPHGALYHKACNDFEIAEMLSVLILKEFPKLKVMGLPNSVLAHTCKKAGIVFLKEGFADRCYEQDGSLRSRTKNGAMLLTAEQVINQVKLLQMGKVKTYCNNIIKVDVDSICFHGDNDNAHFLIKAVSNAVK